jgi:multicomponent Na+:H+ antiporter subunit E
VIAFAGGVVALTLIWSLTLASFDPVDLLVGASLSTVLTAFLGDRLVEAPTGREGPMLRRILWFPVFVAAVFADIGRGTWDVALRVLHLRPLERPGIVAVPIGERSHRGVAVSALATTLSPGTVLIDIDWDREVMLLHVIDASDPDGVRAREQGFYERFQRRVFP